MDSDQARCSRATDQMKQNRLRPIVPRVAEGDARRANPTGSPLQERSPQRTAGLLESDLVLLRVGSHVRGFTHERESLGVRDLRDEPRVLSRLLPPQPVVEMSHGQCDLECRSQAVEDLEETDGVHTTRDGDEHRLPARHHVATLNRLPDPSLQHEPIVARALCEINACPFRHRGVRCGMRCVPIILCLLALSQTGAAFPHLALVDPAVAETLGDPGHLSVEVGISQHGNPLWLAAAAGHRVDLSVGLGNHGLTSFGVRALVLEDLGPLRGTLELGTSGVGFVGGLLLGPVRLDGARIFGGPIRRSMMATLAVSDRLALVVGGEEKAGMWSLLLGLRLSGQSAMWWASAWIREGGLELRIGGMS